MSGSERPDPQRRSGNLVPKLPDAGKGIGKRGQPRVSLALLRSKRPGRPNATDRLIKKKKTEIGD